MKIYGWGGIKLAELTDDPVSLGYEVALVDGMMWMQTDGLHMVRNGGTERLVTDGVP